MESSLRDKIRLVVDKAINYDSMLSAYQTSHDKIKAESRELKSMIDLNPKVTEFLKLLQLKQHENVVGSYETLLTSLLMEVLPGYREVVLDLTMSRQMPAIDVLIKKAKDSPTEDVIRGSGGSVTNIIVAGFRIISVVRSGNRKFLLLDEADCWLKDDYFPAFSKMLKEVSEKLGVQILMISHDKNSYFSGVIEHQVELYKDDSGKIRTRFNKSPEWDVDADIMRSIKLENFQAHENTFIPLSQTITILRGDNDLGKSSVASALRSVFYGEGAETDIKHFTDKTKVTIEFNKNGECLIWERKIKGVPLETYYYYSNVNGYKDPLHKTSGLPKGNVPDWLMSETGIGKFDGLDVQLTWQKNPLAFLGDGPHVRAKALSIGLEADHVQKMMVLAKKKNTENKAMLKSKDSLIEEQRQYIVPLKKVKSIDVENINSLVRSIESRDLEIAELNRSLSELDLCDKKINYLSMSKIDPIKIDNKDQKIVLIKDDLLEISSLESKISIVNKIKGVSFVNRIDETINSKASEMVEVVNNYKKARFIFLTLLKIKPISVIQLKATKILDTQNIEDFIVRFDKSQKEGRVLSKISKINMIERFNDTNHKIGLIKSVGVEIRKTTDNVNFYKEKIDTLKMDYDKKKVEILKLYPVCPTCNQVWNHDH